MEIEEVRKEVEELYRELVRRKYERAIKKGASEQALANFIALHEKFLPAFVGKEMKWIAIIEEEEKREGGCHLVSVRKHFESFESFVIQSGDLIREGHHRCGRRRTADVTTAANCDIRVT